MTRIFVPQPIPTGATQRLEALGEVTIFPHTDRRISRGELLESVRGQNILYALGEIPYDEEVIAAADSLELIAAMHVSATFVDIPAATKRGIPVTGITKMIAATTAEFAFALIIGTAWRLAEADRFLRAGDWQQNQSMAFLGSRIHGKTLGIVGMGTIGKMVAHMAHACGMKIRYHNRNRLSSAEEGPLGAEYRDLDDLFAEADVVSIHTALTRETKGMIGAHHFGLMKPTSIFINTSRGQVIDETALEQALIDGRIRGAGLDVYREEVPEAQSPGPSERMRQLPNCIFTPHIGTSAWETREEMAAMAVDNIEAFLAGERPPVLLNPEVFGEAARDTEVIG